MPTILAGLFPTIAISIYFLNLTWFFWIHFFLKFWVIRAWVIVCFKFWLHFRRMRVFELFSIISKETIFFDIRRLAFFFDNKNDDTDQRKTPIFKYQSSNIKYQKCFPSFLKKPSFLIFEDWRFSLIVVIIFIKAENKTPIFKYQLFT